MNIKNYIINKAKPLTRFLARFLDYSIFYTVLILPLFFGSLFNSDLTHLLAILSIPALWVPIEALLISLLGTTPGKALFGIQIRDSKERKLPFKLSLKRAALTWVKGMGFNLPVVNLGCAIYRFYQIKKTGRTSLDEDLNVQVYQKKKRSLRTLLGSALVALFSLFFIAEHDVKEVVTSTEASFFSKDRAFLKSSGSTNWTNYEDPEGAYAIQFPGTPEAESTQLAIPRSKEKLPFHTIQFDKEGVEYSLNYTTLPKNWLKWKPSLLLKGALKVLSSHLSQGKILKKTAKSYNSYPSLEFMLAKKNNLKCSGRLVLVDNVLYKIDMTYPEELEEEIQEELNTFLESFEPKK